MGFEGVLYEKDEDKVIYEKGGGVAKIILNRPEKMNALTFGMLDGIDRGITRAEEDDDVRVVILKGAGGAFSPGADLTNVSGPAYARMETKLKGKTIENASQRIRLRVDRHWLDIFRHVFLCQKVTIAQAHGYCLGFGLMFAEKCDLIIGAEDCKFGYSEERLTFGGSTMSPMLIFRVGLTKALELQITGKMIDGKEAARINLINRAVPAEKLEAEVDELARAITLYSRDGLALAKATRHTVYEMLGMNQWFFTGAYLPHALLTYIEYPPGEYDFLKEVKEKGARAAAHERLDSTKALDK